MCRKNVSSNLFLNATRWAIKNDLLREIQVTMYPLNQLDEFDFLFFVSFCQSIGSDYLTQENFNSIESHIKRNMDCNYIYEKLKKTSTTKTMLVKNSEYSSNHLHLFIQ